MEEKKRLVRVEVLRAALKRRMSEALDSGDDGQIATTANLVKVMGIALAPLAPHAEVDPATLTLTVGQVALALGFHPEHVRRLLRCGSLAGERVGRDYQIPLLALAGWLDRQRKESWKPFDSTSPLRFETARAELLSHLALEKEALTWDFYLRHAHPDWMTAGQQPGAAEPKAGPAQHPQQPQEPEG